MKFQIKEAREYAGLSQKDLAERIGVAPNTFHGYESGKHDPKSELLVDIARVCGVSVDFLLGITKEKAPAPSNDDAEAKVDPSVLYDALIRLGFLEEGQDLTDADLRFLLSVGDIIRAWFAERKQ